MLITELISRGEHWHRDRPAFLFGDHVLTFGEVGAAASRLAHALLEKTGLKPGDRIALLYGNTLNGLPFEFACIRAGLQRTPLNPRLSAREHAEMLIHAGIKVLVYGEGLGERARELAASVWGLKLFGLGDAELGPDLLALSRGRPEIAPQIRAEPDDVLINLFTSGTTGKLKAVSHTHRTYSAIAANVLANLIDPEPDGIMLHAAPLIHASGTFVLPFWMRGAASAVLPGFDPGGYFAAIEKWRPTALNLVPTMVAMLLDHPAAQEADLSSVDTILYGASPMPRPVIERGLALWGPRFVQYYGQTEAPLAICVLDKQAHVGEGAEARWGACGRPATDCEIRLIDEAGKDVKPGEPGEVALRAPFRMKGYLEADALNAETILPGDWLRTRDIGRWDDEGYLHLIDRTSDMIVTGGYNVYPREVEDILTAHAAVRECAVVGLPDDRWGEVVTAFVAVREPIEEAVLIAFARERLADYKSPRAVRFVDEIPKSPVGKPLRRALREPFWEGRDKRV